LPANETGPKVNPTQALIGSRPDSGAKSESITWGPRDNGRMAAQAAVRDRVGNVQRGLSKAILERERRTDAAMKGR
jgi:hypothetical protein